MDDSSTRSGDGDHQPGPESEAAKTTIVGARPASPGRQQGDVPRGIEVLIKKASLDPAFRQLLLDRRAEAAREIDLQLSAAEVMALNAVPREQMEKIIAHTTVPDPQRRAFLGQVGAVMLAALTLGLSGCDTPTGQSAVSRRPTDKVIVVEKGVTIDEERTRVAQKSARVASITVDVQDAGPGSATVVVRYYCPYECPFDKGEVTIDFRQSPDVPGANITCQPPQPAAVVMGTGEITFHASGSGGATNWLIVGLRSTTADCQNSPALSPPRAYQPNQYIVDKCAVWKVVEYHKNWSSQG